MNSQEKIIKPDNLSLSDWLELIKSRPKKVRFVNYQFPTEAISEEFLRKIHDFSEETIELVLRSFLIHTGALGSDYTSLEFLERICREDSKRAAEILKKVPYYRRLVISVKSKGRIPIRNGITWVLDLLPDYPKQALDALESYFLAHAYSLPNGRINGLSDAMAIIRARYFFLRHPEDILNSLEPYQFEHLIDELFYEMEYKTTLTQKTYDGGRDIIAEKIKPGFREKNLIQCRRTKKNVGVDALRSLLGVVSDEKATKGTLVTSAEFTPKAKALYKRNSRLDIIGHKNLQVLLNKHLGASWPRRLDYFISNSIKRQKIPN